jgi:hypothetical protein
MHVQLLPLAVQRLYEIVNDKKLPAADRLRAATSILDRTGLGPGSTVQIDQTVHVLPPAEIFIEAITGARDRLTKAGIVRYADAEFVQPGEVDPEPDATELDGPDAEVLAFPVPDFI